MREHFWSYASAYLGSALAMLVLDGLWLTFAANKIYRPHLGDMLADGFRLGPAALFYFLYVAGIVVLAVAPGLKDGWQVALWRGLALGLIAYGTYDLTNQATLRHWSTTVTIVDMIWGTLLTGVSAVAGFFAARWAASF